MVGSQLEPCYIYNFDSFLMNELDGDKMKLSNKLMTAAVMLASAQLANAAEGWGVYGGDTGNTRYSEAKQVTTANVNNLQVKWALQLGTNRSQ